MWILHADGTYHHRTQPEWMVRRQADDLGALRWALYKGTTLIGRFDTLEQAVGAGPA